MYIYIYTYMHAKVCVSMSGRVCVSVYGYVYVHAQVHVYDMHVNNVYIDEIPAKLVKPDDSSTPTVAENAST